MSASDAPKPSSSVEVLPRKPGLRSTRPERYEQGLVARDILRAFVARKKLTIRELALCWQVSPKVVHEKLRGDRPVHWEEILLLSETKALDVLDEIRLVVLQRRTG